MNHSQQSMIHDYILKAYSHSSRYSLYRLSALPWMYEMKSYIFNYSIHENAFSSTASYCEPSCLFHITVQEPSFKGNKSFAMHHCLKDTDRTAKQKPGILLTLHSVKFLTCQGQQFSTSMRITEKVPYRRKFPNVVKRVFLVVFCLVGWIFIFVVLFVFWGVVFCFCLVVWLEIMPLRRYTHLKNRMKHNILCYRFWPIQPIESHCLPPIAKNIRVIHTTVEEIHKDEQSISVFSSVHTLLPAIGTSETRRGTGNYWGFGLLTLRRLFLLPLTKIN